MAGPNSREAPHKYLQIQQFRTLNSQPSRTAIEQDEFAWIENLMPIGDAYAPAVPGPAAFASLNPSTGTNIVAVAPNDGGGTELWSGGGTATVEITAPETPIIWDSSHMHSGYGLSNSDLTVTVLNDGGGRLENSSVRAVTSRSSGKKYLEIDSDCSHASQYGSVGLATSLLSENNYVGETTASWGYFTSGSLIHNGGLVQSYGAWDSFQPAWFGIAVDFDAGKAWFSMVQSGGTRTWQGGGDPVAGTNPAFTFSVGVSLFPAWTGAHDEGGGDYAIISSTTAAFHLTPPTGFTSWASP